MLCCKPGDLSQQTINVLVGAHISQTPENSRGGSPKDICSQKVWNKRGTVYIEICSAQGKPEADWLFIGAQHHPPKPLSSQVGQH